MGNGANNANSNRDDAGTPAKVKGGAKKVAAPRKRAPAKAKAKPVPKVKDDENDSEAGELMDDDDDEAVTSPSMLPVTPKKGTNNKVCVFFLDGLIY